MHLGPSTCADCSRPRMAKCHYFTFLALTCTFFEAECLSLAMREAGLLPMDFSVHRAMHNALLTAALVGVGYHAYVKKRKLLQAACKVSCLSAEPVAACFFLHKRGIPCLPAQQRAACCERRAHCQSPCEAVVLHALPGSVIAYT